MKFIVSTTCLILTLCLYTGCEKRGISPLSDDDSDRPAWAGGNTDLNTHSKGNIDVGVPKGEDYGDLYVLIRDEEGVPIMAQTDAGVWYPWAMAFDAAGVPVYVEGDYLPLEVNAEGEIEDDHYFPHEVEFGRMNIVRAPESVLSAGLAEAINNLKLANYITCDASGRLVAVHGELDWLPGVLEEDDKTIDSPRENLAIYRELMRNGFTGELSFLLSDGFTDEDLLQVAAGALAAGSDKTGTMTIDEVAYINGFMDAYNDDLSINLISIYPGCTDDYYNALKFYDYNLEYDRTKEYEKKWLKVTTLNSDGTFDVKVESVLDAVSFSELRIEDIDDIAGFTHACDDAVQVLEYIHESDLIEYLGEHDEAPEL